MSRMATTQKFGRCVVICEQCNDINWGNCKENIFILEYKLRFQKKYSCHDNGHFTAGHSTYIFYLLVFCNFNAKVRRSIPNNEDLWNMKFMWGRVESDRLRMGNESGICGRSYNFIRWDEQNYKRLVTTAAISRQIVTISNNSFWCGFDRASSLIRGNKMPTRCNRGFYCRSYCLLNMFRAPLCPSSGAQEYYTVVAACGISCCAF